MLMILRALPRDNTLNPLDEPCFEDVAQGILVICVGVAPSKLRSVSGCFSTALPALVSGGCDGGP